MSNAQSGVGVSFKKGDGTSNESFTAIAEVKNLNGPSMSRGTIDVTNLDSTGGYREFITAFRDGGECSMTMNFTRAGYDDLKTDFDSEDSVNYQISIPSPNAMTLEFTGYITNLAGPNATPDGAIEAEVTIKIDGEITWSSGA